eukprot:scaffold211318_cov33-Tisochrysis_lutea.AAC.2
MQSRQMMPLENNQRGAKHWRPSGLESEARCPAPAAEDRAGWHKAHDLLGKPLPCRSPHASLSRQRHRKISEEQRQGLPFLARFPTSTWERAQRGSPSASHPTKNETTVPVPAAVSMVGPIPIIGTAAIVVKPEGIHAAAPATAHHVKV